MISKINDDSGTIYINIHMEQIFTEVTQEFSKTPGGIGIREDERYIVRNKKYIKSSELSCETIDRIKMRLEAIQQEVVLDFNNIETIQNNQDKELLEFIKRKNTVKIVNASKVNRGNLFDEYILDVGANYADVFNMNAIGYINSITEDKEYITTNGVKLSRYVNVKKIIEDNNDMIKWCYMLALKLYQNHRYKTIIDDNSKTISLLCHTLNGSCIATVLAKLLNLNIVFIDHLGPHNKITKMKFEDNYKKAENYIVVVDFICQGNEIVRAENIVEFTGGNILGYVSFIQLEIAKLRIRDITETVVRVSTHDAKNKLKYTLKTDLCCSET